MTATPQPHCHAAPMTAEDVRIEFRAGIMIVSMSHTAGYRNWSAFKVTPIRDDAEDIRMLDGTSWRVDPEAEPDTP